MATGKGLADSRDALRASPGRESRPGPAAHEHPLRALSPVGCLDLLERGGIGRVGFTSADSGAVLNRPAVRTKVMPLAAATKAREPITALQLLAHRGLDPLTS